MYKHILIAADFSNCAQQVCDRAKALAQQYHSQLSICHLVEDFPIADFAYEPMISIDADMREKLLEAGKEHIATIANSLNIPPQHQWVEFGNPRTDIVRLAGDNAVDLIVVGSHGKHGIQLLLGSTANGVLHHAKCDVLAVRLEQNNNT
jgi:universal stress protein A